MINDLADPLVSRSPSAPPPRSRKQPNPPLTPEVCPDTLQFARQSLNFHPDPKQEAVLNAPHHRLILNCSRQWGKSTVAAAKAVHLALSKPGALIIVAAPVGRQSGEFIQKAQDFVAHLGIRLRGDGRNPNSILLPNRSRLVGIPGSREANIRGFSAVSLLIIDEAARVPDELYHAATPMLAVSRGDLWLLSTPFSTTGFFYQEWKFGHGWTRISVPATECPRIPPDFLEEKRAKMGEQRFRREYMCEFYDLDGSLFARELVEGCFSPEVALLPTTFTTELPVPGHFFIGVDLGQKRDFTAIAILQRRDGAKPHFLTPYDVPPTYYDLRHLERLPLGTPYPLIVKKVEELTQIPLLKNRCTVVADGTGVGGPVVEMLRHANLAGDFIPVTITAGERAARAGHGWNVPRRDLLAALMLTVEDEHLRIAPDLPERNRLVTELMSVHGGSARHSRSSEHDDLVFALALAAWRARQDSPFGHQNTGRLL